MRLFLKRYRTVTTVFSVLCAATMLAGGAHGQAPAAGAGGAGRPAGAAGGPGAAPGPLTVHKLTDTVYWTNGGTGVSNSGIIIGTDGVILFDPKGTVDAGQAVIAEVAKLTPKPITTVMVSHAHPDHTRGLPAYSNVNIIAQRETARQIEMETFYYTWNAAAAGGDASGADKPYLATQV